ncbi:Toprim domain-containing protein [Sulfitobacter litoralis]|uniref:Toprim domain-containing protein n=1 Tax=Sulfitobacter litoralis TaxID=335975 RepID=A0ABY0T3L7_9RHOB|nr:toprim domain-containing protein [Sulfitobacter litoralis]SDP76688.1 Toprim domain-containing protein [Sulfitobacter litoralis]
MTNAQEITSALGGKWHQTYGTAPCPCCQLEMLKQQNALTLSTGSGGQLLAHCKRAGCAFTDILSAAGFHVGYNSNPCSAEIAKRDEYRRMQIQRKAELAKRLWKQAKPISGTLAETYLREARGITCPLPEALRFHPDVWHGPTAQCWPAMVAAVQGVPFPAVHRTFLLRDGSGKAGLEGGDKLMLGGTQGGAVRLRKGSFRLVVVEGIETGLSLSCGLLDGPVTIWSALSTSGIRGLHLPKQPALLTIAPDGDEPGRAAANALAERAHALGWKVSILDPGNGCDFNDVLLEGAES